MKTSLEAGKLNLASSSSISEDKNSTNSWATIQQFIEKNQSKSNNVIKGYKILKVDCDE